MQGSIQGYHHHLCFCVLPVDSTQPVDDALDSLENRRGQLAASDLMGGEGGVGRGREGRGKGEQEGFPYSHRLTSCKVCASTVTCS